MTRRPRLLLHIGTHKTGTTSIQQALHQQRDALRAHGVLLADTARPPWPELPKHTSVFHAAWTGDAAVREAEREALWQEFSASGAHTLLLSEEGLSEPDPRPAAFFEPWRERFDIQVVCLLRRHDRFVESLYNQFTREAVRREARSPLTFARSAAVRARLDYSAMLRRWQEGLGAGLVVRDFDALQRGGGLLRGFAEAAGLPPEVPLPERHSNGSPDMRLSLVLRRLHAAGLPHQQGALVEAAGALIKEGRFAPWREVLGADERRRLLQACAEDARALEREHGVVFDTGLPEGEPGQARDEVEPAFLIECLAWLSRRAPR